MSTDLLTDSPDIWYAEKQQIASVGNRIYIENTPDKLPEIVFITSHPPRECGIATYSQDLIKALNNKFKNGFILTICAIESESEIHSYTKEVKYILNTDDPNGFTRIAHAINHSADISMILLQHEFGFFAHKKNELVAFLESLRKPVITVFHTVLPTPDKRLQLHVKTISTLSASIIVMTHTSMNLLMKHYGIPYRKITVIEHGTHLVPHVNKEVLKKKYQLEGRKILSTFGLLSSGKSIETTLNALPAIIAAELTVLFLIIGKTHPSVVKQEGETYRYFLQEKIEALALQEHVLFINQFLPLPVLLDYLQLTDIYLFTSNDPNQAVSGTFSYAISCGCPIISTAIPHAREVLQDNAGIIINFRDSEKLSSSVITLLTDEWLCKKISLQGLHRMASTAWENSAIAHTLLFEKISNKKIILHHSIPAINLNHIKKMTTHFGMIQFSEINHPDIKSGYTLDDNARALIAMCQHFELHGTKEDLTSIATYLHFIKFCLQPEGYFLNYVDEAFVFTEQNYTTNLADANGRAIWALGYVLSMKAILPDELTAIAEQTMRAALLRVNTIHSTRAMAFVIKGLYYRNLEKNTADDQSIIKHLADRLVQMYRHEADENWCWFESYMTYANSLLPEAMLCAWLATGDTVYRDIAKKSFDFLLSKTFTANTIRVISNKTWLHKGNEPIKITDGGEQPIDVAYTILALSKFYEVFREPEYLHKTEKSFNWFLGNNHLQQIMYNPCTGGCYDGLEERSVNLNQGAESTVSYLMARLTIEKLSALTSVVKRGASTYTEDTWHFPRQYVNDITNTAFAIT